MKNKILSKRSIILLSVLFLGIGFALLTTDLRILGNTTVSRNSWNIYFDNVEITEGSASASVNPTTTGKTTTSLNFTVNLDEPGDYYEFTVDAVNDGTLDAVIENVNMTSLDSNTAKYLTYTATYVDGTSIEEDNILTRKTTATYKVRVEFKKDIVAADLDENGINLELSFGVEYNQYTPIATESNFVKLIKSSAASDSDIDFSQNSTLTNKNGIFVKEDTKSDTYPIYYYYGNVNNNNVMFAGFCWKIVRTTETGGTKLIYNGLPGNTYKSFERLNESSYLNVSNDATYPFTFNQQQNRWENNYNMYNDDEEQITGSTITFQIAESGNYILNYKNENMYDDFYGVEAIFYKNDVEVGSYYGWDGGSFGSISLENLTTGDILKIEYKNPYMESVFSFNLEKGLGESVIGCTNTTGEATQISNSKYNPNGLSLAYNGYMYGNVYEQTEVVTTISNYTYASSFTYENGTYSLVNTNATPDSNHHYACLSNSQNCTEVAYIFYATYYNNYGRIIYIKLKDGKSVEDALAEMYVNINDSTIKTTIDTWFHDTFMTYFTQKNKDYNNYLEDTIWCNDRSWSTIENYSTVNNGWNPNGSIGNSVVLYSPFARIATGTYSLTCPNKNDAFTVNDTVNGNGALTYPVGLLTVDEVILAGGGGCGDNYGGGGSDNKEYYLYTNEIWWTNSPSKTRNNYVVYYRGGLDPDNFGVGESFGVRPSISIKPDIKIAPGGDGTAGSPYVFVVE